jgi:hypothetical protein
MSRTPSGGRQYPQRAPPVNPLPVGGGEFDEFGDDLELSAEDLQELMTQPPPLHQRPLHQIPAHPNPPLQQKIDAGTGSAGDTGHPGLAKQLIVLDEFDDDDDEFGCNDFDEVALAQAELSATQAIRASLPRYKSAARQI